MTSPLRGFDDGMTNGPEGPLSFLSFRH